MFTFDVHLESAVERECYSSVDDTRVMTDLDLCVEKFLSEFFKLALAAFRCHLLEVRKTGNVPVLAFVLLLIQFQVVKVLHQSMSDHHFVVQNLFQLKSGYI